MQSRSPTRASQAAPREQSKVSAMEVVALRASLQRAQADAAQLKTALTTAMEAGLAAYVAARQEGRDSLAAAERRHERELRAAVTIASARATSRVHTELLRLVAQMNAERAAAIELVKLEAAVAQERAVAAALEQQKQQQQQACKEQLTVSVSPLIARRGQSLRTIHASALQVRAAVKKMVARAATTRAEAAASRARAAATDAHRSLCLAAAAAGRSHDATSRAIAAHHRAHMAAIRAAALQRVARLAAAGAV